MKRFFLFILCLVSIACGSEDRPPPAAVGTSTGGKTSFHGTGGGGGAGATDGGGEGGDSGNVSAPGSPVVQILSPDEVLDPNAGGVITDSEVTVVCSVEASASADAGAVDPASIELEMLDQAGNVLGTESGSPAGVEGRYSAIFFMTDVPTGLIRFSCSASTTGDSPLTGTAEISTFVDHGPTIQVTSPTADSSFPLGLVSFEFNVLPVELVPGDTGSAVQSVTLTINGLDIPLPTPVGSTYTVPVNFADQTQFPVSPSGATTVEIHATDARGAEANLTYSFVIDGNPPAITIESPLDGAVVGGRVTLKFTVIDPPGESGVKPESVTVTVTSGTQIQGQYPSPGEWVHADNTDSYWFTFESRLFDKVQINVTIVAADNAGNMSPGESLNLYIDNKPPYVDLDPSNVRESTGTACSGSFDPLGVAASDLSYLDPDGYPFSDFVLLRAFVWDRTNSGANQTTLYLAGTDESSVFLYLQPTDTPLLIDTNYDGICDELQTTQLFQHLTAIRPQGNADFSVSDPAVPPLPPAGCALGVNQYAPTALCQGASSDLTRVTHHGDIFGDTPVVYGIGDLTEPECTGSQWSLASAGAREGWNCLAARAVDKVGNVGISPPLRICFDDGIAPPPTCDPFAAPDCTDGCTPPARFPGAIIVNH